MLKMNLKYFYVHVRKKHIVCVLDMFNVSQSFIAIEKPLMSNLGKEKLRCIGGVFGFA